MKTVYTYYGDNRKHKPKNISVHKSKEIPYMDPYPTTQYVIDTKLINPLTI